MPPARGLCPWRLSRGPPRPASVTPRWLAARLPRGHWAPPPSRFPSAGPAAPRSAPCLSVSLVPDDLTTNTAHLLLTELTSARSPGSERPVGGHGQLQGGLRRLRPVGRPALGQREAEAALAEERRAPFRSPALNPRRAPGANRPAAPPGAAVRHRGPRHCPAACVTSPARPSATSSSPGAGGGLLCALAGSRVLRLPPPDKALHHLLEEEREPAGHSRGDAARPGCRPGELAFGGDAQGRKGHDDPLRSPRCVPTPHKGGPQAESGRWWPGSV